MFFCFEGAYAHSIPSEGCPLGVARARRIAISLRLCAPPPARVRPACCRCVSPSCGSTTTASSIRIIRVVRGGCPNPPNKYTTPPTIGGRQSAVRYLRRPALFSVLENQLVVLAAALIGEYRLIKNKLYTKRKTKKHFLNLFIWGLQNWNVPLSCVLLCVVNQINSLRCILSSPIAFGFVFWSHKAKTTRCELVVPRIFHPAMTTTTRIAIRLHIQSVSVDGRARHVCV